MAKKTSSAQLNSTAQKKPEFTPHELLKRDLVEQKLFVCDEHLFHEDRKWRLDFAWPAQKLAAEINGLGRHNRPAGMAQDDNKCNCALELGWRVLRFSAGIVRTNKRRARIVEQIKRILCGVADPDESTIVLVGDFEN